MNKISKLWGMSSRYAYTLMFVFISLTVSAQNVSLKMEKKPLKDVLTEITKATGYKFVYSDALKEIKDLVTIKCNNEDLKIVLNKIFKEKGISYKIEGKNIALTPVEMDPDYVDSNKPTVFTGVVRDSSGETVPGVSILNRGSRDYTSSDLDGRYSILVKDGDVLRFSFLGMKERDLRVSPKVKSGNIVLEDDAISLEDAIVTGYQTISKERSTGSFTRISAEVLADKPVINIADALVGLTPGMTMSPDNQGFNRFLIRGDAQIMAQYNKMDQDPLIVVDGFAIQNTSWVTDPFETINPNDVESITVLKDAAATSIYGSRAANGVIVITTKKGRGDKLDINFDAFVSISNKPNLDYAFNLANTDATISYLENLEKYNPNFHGTDPYSNIASPYANFSNAGVLLWEYKRANNISQSQYEQGLNELRAQDGKWMDDYNKYLFRNKITQQYNLNLRGSTNKNKYSFSVVYDTELGTEIGDKRDRIVMNFSNSYEVIKNLTVSVGVNAHFGKNKNNGIELSEVRANTAPFTRLVDDNGNFISLPWAIRGGGQTLYEPIYTDKYEGKTAADWRYNPVQDRDEKTSTSENFNFRVQSSIDYKIIEGLSISLKGQYENNNYSSEATYSDQSFRIRNNINKFSTLNSNTGLYETHFPAGGMYSTSGTKYTSYNLRGQLDFNRKIADKHDITALLGAELLSSTGNNIPSYGVYGYNEFTNSVLAMPDYLNRVKTIFGSDERFPFGGLGTLSTIENRVMSAYANASYTYDGRYSISASARADASNFVSDDVRKKFSPFWHVGLAWNIGNEKFMEQAPFVDFLKIRASIGTAGIAAGKSDVSTLTTVGTYSGSLVRTNNEPFNRVNAKGNPTLTWEKSRTLNVGIDFSLWGRALYGSIEYYDRYSYDVLAKATVPYLSQSSSTSTFNNAKISNKGLEVVLGSEMRITDRISWNGNMNFAWNRNRVLEYNENRITPGGTFVEGRPMYPLYAYEVVGYTPEGYQKLKGKDGTIEIVKDRESAHMNDNLEEGQSPDDSNWYRYFGTRTAPVNMAFSNTFKIYDFTLSFMLTGKFGHVYWMGGDGGSQLAHSNVEPGYSKYLLESMEMDKNGYVGEYGPMPMFNDDNRELFNTFYDTVTNMHRNSSAQYKDASHIRLNEIYLGYDLPKKLFKKSKLGGLRIYAQAKNLGIIWAANGEGSDPDYPLGSMKPMAIWTLGLKVNF